MRRADADWGGGFALLSSRCSYELVEKAALSNCPLLVTISAPTRLAAERARAVALPLVVLARADALLSQRSEEHTSELQSLMRISYDVFCLKKKKTQPYKYYNNVLLRYCYNFTLNN